MKINIDTDVAKSAAARLKNDHNHLENLEKDPQGFLKTLGIEVDNDTAQTIRDHVHRHRSGQSKAQASAVHIDV